MKNRELTLKAALLAVIEEHRAQTGDPLLGASLEDAILKEDLNELDRQAQGDMELVLLRRRKK